MGNALTNVLVASGVIGAMGLIFGAVLSIIGKKFEVPENPLQTAVRGLLPGANCGGCGYPGCDGYAAAVANGSAPVNKCPVGGDSAAQAIGQLMGVEAEAQDKLVATVMCRGGSERCQTRFEYQGPMDCKSMSLAAQGDKACWFSCLGLGDCQKSCQFGAIVVDDNRLARVDPDKCKSCGMCVASCPRGILQLLPQSVAVHRICSAMERGKVVRDICTAGCISCGKCERSCKFGALKMVNNLPEIDIQKCTGCMQCADSCPTGALRSNETKRRRAVINLNKCDGCDACAKVCKFEAITKNEEGKHMVVDWNCTGCGACQKVCPNGSVQMQQGAKYRN